MLEPHAADAIAMASRERCVLGARRVATLGATGAGLGLVLAASRSEGSTAAARGCAAAARRIGSCAPSSLTAARPYVTAGLVGLLLGILIAIAAILAWREVLDAVGSLRRRERAAPRPAVASRGRAGSFAPRIHH
jgi:hypothetical protein